MKNVKYLKVLVIIAVIIILAMIVWLLVSKTNDQSGNTNIDNQTIDNSIANAQVYAVNGQIVKNEADHLIGSRKAPITIFVYEDNSNIYSAELAETLHKIYLESDDQVAIIARPLVAENNSASKEVALLLECAAEQDKWSEMRQLVFAKVQEGSLDLTTSSLYGQELGLNNEQLSTCLTSEEKYAKIEELNAQAENYGIIGAPTMFIGEEMILGARPYDDYIDSNGDKIEGLKTLIAKKIQ